MPSFHMCKEPKSPRVAQPVAKHGKPYLKTEPIVWLPPARKCFSIWSNEEKYIMKISFILFIFFPSLTLTKESILLPFSQSLNIFIISPAKNFPTTPVKEKA